MFNPVNLPPGQFGMVGNFNNSRRTVVEEMSVSAGIRSRQRFTPEEDAELLRVIEMIPEGSWEDIAKHLPGRTSRQVRERYRHYLCPELNLSPWTSEEESLLRSKFEEYGPQWSILKMFFPNRSAVNIKNHWTTMISRQSRDAWETRTIIPSESNHSDPSTQITSSVVIVPSIDDSSQSTIIPPQSSSPENPSTHMITGMNQSIEQENKHVHPMDIFDLNLLQNFQFPLSDMFIESYFSHP
jgi:hypothetical protein